MDAIRNEAEIIFCMVELVAVVGLRIRSASNSGYSACAPCCTHLVKG